MYLTAGLLQRQHLLHAIVALLQPDHAALADDPPAQHFDLSRHFLPKLAGTILRVQEAFDQAGFNVLLLDRAGAPTQHAKHCMLHGGSDTEAFDTLPAPFAADFGTGYPPNLL